MQLKTYIIILTLLTNWQLIAAPSTSDSSQVVNEYRNAGGPDAYGYTWADSDEIDGPTFNWIDITGVGTEVIGLADDNSVPMIPMGMSFQYYWITFSDIKIGSNGWLSFDDVSNVAHCFPTIPTAGGSGDNLVAPFMSDLNFVGNSNPAQVFYYHDNVNQLFIVSYLNVPWWTNAIPDYVGSNTFQVIFSAVDNSITFQYLDTDPANFNNTGACANDLEIGIENNTGNIGLEVFNETLPADNYAVKFSYPKTPLINVIDVAPLWSQNANNAAQIAIANEDVSVTTHVINNGNADTTMAFDVDVVIEDELTVQVYSDAETVTGLTAQEETDISFLSLFNDTPGNYSLIATTTSSEDINPGNNSNTNELVLVDNTISPTQLSYVTEDINTGVLSWNGGTGGVGTLFETPLTGWWLTSVELFVTDNNTAAQDFTVGVYANDNGDGLPGTLIDSVLVPTGSVALNDWVTVQFSSPVAVPPEGFFVSWEQNNADGIGIGNTTTAPISRSSYELLGGQWSVSRTNNNTDFMFRVNMIDLIFEDGLE